MRRSFPILIIVFLTSVSAWSQSFTGSNLPIVIINTDGGYPVPDDPRILATMKIINRGEGQRNLVTDQNNSLYLDYNGRISIETRGSSSQELPKKQYGLTTLKADNITNNNISLLGLPAENDWILNGLAFDAALMRDYLHYNLSRRIGNYASRTVYCELILNGSYNGLYVLQEKIKQGEKRVDVKKISATDIKLPEITGGYITKSDKTGGDPVAWKMSSPNGTNDVNFIHHMPKPDEARAEQTAYIKNEFMDLSSAASSKNISLVNGIPSIIDIPSFVDFMLLNEFASNPDAYQFSTFFHKDRNGKLRAGPIWDMNLTFGNDLFLWGYDRSKTDVWQFANGFNDGATFWKNLFNVPVFRCLLASRWTELTRAGQPLSQVAVEAFIDSTAVLIGEAAAREQARWGTVGNFSEEIAKMKTWIGLRTAWLSSRLSYQAGCNETNLGALVINRIMYGPAENDPEFIEIKNTGSSSLDLTGVYFRGTGLVYQFPPNTTLPAGSSFFLTNDLTAFQNKYGFVPFGEYTRKLSDEGMDIVLADGFGVVIDHVKYSPLAPWPEALGTGYYLELTNAGYDNNDPASWIAVNNQLPGSGAGSGLDVTVFPNPVITNVTVRAESNIDLIEIFGLHGAVVMSVKPDSSEAVLELTRLGQGVWFIRIHSGSQNVVRKIIKM
jgi:hypothetical protein